MIAENIDLVLCISHCRDSVIIGKSGKGMVSGLRVEWGDNTQLNHSGLLEDINTLNEERRGYIWTEAMQSSFFHP